MVSTSNCPPLVAMSVVTRWRRTFSSSVTHFTDMSGFLAVNSLVSACIRIMSPLFTVAMVRVVCAMEGAAPNKVAAPRRALRTCFTVTSLTGVEHMPTPCNYVHTEPEPCQASESGFCTGLRGERWRFDGSHARDRRAGAARAGLPGMKGRSVRYGLRMAPAVASSVIRPFSSRPFSAALMAETLARPTAAPMVRAWAGTRGGMLVIRRFVPPSMM